MKFKIFFLLLFSITLSFSQADTSSAKSSRYRSPTGAMIRSAILPGLGQFYNHSYWKIPIIYGLGAYFVYEFKQNDKNYKYYKELYTQSLSTGGDYRYRRLRDFYRDQRDLFGIYLFLLYVANIVDAYVDAHLSNFDVSDKLSIQVLPGKLTFKLKCSW